MWCFGTTKSVRFNQTEEETSQDDALLGTFCKNSTAWITEFERVEKNENERVIVTPGFPNNAV